MLTLGGEERASLAIKSLERAEEISQNDASVLNDLAASHALLAQERDEPFDLVRALDYAERALAENPDFLPAAFNAAWILEQLHLPDQATVAWERYLELDHRSGWAEEARANAASVASLLDLAPRRRQRMVEVAYSGAENLLELVALDAQAAREIATEEVLSEWSRRLLASDAVGAGVALEAAERIGQMLLETGGSRTVAEACAAARRAESSPEDLLELARGYLGYADGHRHFENLEVEDAEQHFLEASQHLARFTGPVKLWTEIGLAGVALYRNDHLQAERRFRSVLEDATDRGYSDLAGRSRWGLGLIRSRRGLFSSSLRYYQAAAESFNEANEFGNHGAIHVLIAENLRFLGQERSSWKHRFQAGSLLAGHDEPRWLYNLFWESANSAHQVAHTHAALALQDGALKVAERLMEPVSTAEALLWRSKIQIGLENLESAKGDLRRARSLIPLAGSPAIRERIEADILYSEAELQRRLDPKEALPVLDDAIDFYRQRRLFPDLASAYLSRARARLAAESIGRAESDLRSAVELFESQRASIEDEGQQRFYAETGQELFDELIALVASRAQDAEESLEVAERARLVQARMQRVSGELAVAPAIDDAMKSLRLDLAGLTENAALIEYAWLPDRLLIWTVHGGRVELTVRHVQRDQLEDLVRAFVHGLRSSEVDQELNAKLFTILLPDGLRERLSATVLYIVPDKSLNGVPFAALRDVSSGRYLIEDLAISVAPSALALLRILERESAHTVSEIDGATLVGDPDFDRTLFPHLPRLPGASEEIRQVADLYDKVTVLQGETASRQSLLQLLDRHAVFHYAGHAVGNTLRPAHSYLVLAADPDSDEPDLLFAHEIENRRFRHLRLVVLSACDTIGASDSRVVGLSGLARPFIDAGASAVVGSLWAVEDRVAQQLLPEFHRQLRVQGNAAEALRQAQLALMRSEPEGAAAWGSFQLIGAAL